MNNVHEAKRDVSDRLMEGIYYSLARMERDDKMSEVHFRELRVRVDNKASGTVLVIVKGDWDGLPVIAFHQDQGVVLATWGALTRGDRGKLKWRIDRYAMQDKGYDQDSIEAAERELEGLQGRET